MDQTRSAENSLTKPTCWVQRRGRREATGSVIGSATGTRPVKIDNGVMTVMVVGNKPDGTVMVGQKMGEKSAAGLLSPER